MKKSLWMAGIACSLLAADSTVEGPKLGYVNSAAGVRSVLGLVGSSRFSAPVTGQLEGGAVLPGADAVIAKNPAGALVRVNLNDGSVASLGVGDVAGFVVSPSGAAILARTADKLHVIQSNDAQVKVEYATPGAPQSMAVSDTGPVVALTVAEADGEALYLIDEQGSRRVVRSAGIVALAFLPESRDAVFADAEGGIYLLKADLQFAQIATVKGATAVAGATDGRILAVAGKKITALRRDGSTAASIECSCEATIARPLGGSRFVLTSGDGPTWMVDASAEELRIAFIPEAVNE